jgi:hypothetical protein
LLLTGTELLAAIGVVIGFLYGLYRGDDFLHVVLYAILFGILLPIIYMLVVVLVKIVLVIAAIVLVLVILYLIYNSLRYGYGKHRGRRRYW